MNLTDMWSLQQSTDTVTNRVSSVGSLQDGAGSLTALAFHAFRGANRAVPGTFFRKVFITKYGKACQIREISPVGSLAIVGLQRLFRS